jgi:carbamoyl-phosphate synthase large subunit
MITVGITAVGSGIGQPVLDSVRLSSLEARIVGFDASPWAKGGFECDRFYLLPRAGHPDYATQLIARCQEEGIQILLPGSDTELIPLADAAPALESVGCRVVVSSPEVVRICRDKLEMSRYLDRAGAPFAKTWSLETAREQADELPYPVVVKPRGGSGSVGVRIISEPADLLRIPLNGDLIVQPHLFPASWYDGPEGIKPYLERMAQSGLPLQQDEISVQLMVSRKGKLLGRYAGFIGLKAGVMMLYDPIDDEAVWEATEKFVNAMVPLGLRGPCLLQSRKTKDGLVFWEANPRFAGGTGVRTLMGYNEVEAAIRDFLLEEDEDSVKACLKMRTDVVGLRQMTEIVVPRERFDRLMRLGQV